MLQFALTALVLSLRENHRGILSFSYFIFEALHLFLTPVGKHRLKIEF